MRSPDSSPSLGPITLQAVSGAPIYGQIKQSQKALDAGYDIGPDFPATSTFDVTFEVAGDFGVTEPVGPLSVSAELVKVPPVTPSDTIDPPGVRPGAARKVAAEGVESAGTDGGEF